MNESCEEARGGEVSRRVAVMCPDAGVDAAYFAAALAAYLAKVGADRRAPVVLVDGQPGTGGLDVLCDLDTVAGARWPALRGAGVDIDAQKLLAALPQRDGVAVLSHSRSGHELEPEVRAAVCNALAGLGASLVLTVPPHAPPSALIADCLVLLVRGTVASLAAAEHVMSGLDDLPVALVALQAPQATRSAMTEALGAPVACAGPARWRLGESAADDVLNGRWPGSDRIMQRLVRDVSVFAATSGRSLAWA